MSCHTLGTPEHIVMNSGKETKNRDVESESKSSNENRFPQILWVERDKFVRSVDLAMLQFLRAIKRIARKSYLL